MVKILAVEDEPLVRMLIVETLEGAGHTVLEAGDGEAALALIGEAPDLDFIVTDVRMAKMDGFALATAALKILPELRVLFMTGYAGSEVSARLPGAKVLQKPFDPDELLVAIDSMKGKNAN